MRSKAIITCSLLLASCGKSDDAATGGNGGNGFIQNIGGSTPHTPPPSQKDAIAALKILVNYQSEPVRFIFPIGNPSNCLEGMDGTAKIQACSVCVPVLKIILKQYPNKVLQKVKLEQEIFNIPFRRSISYEQPGISPVNELDGVWALNYQPTSQLSRPNVGYTVQYSVDLTPDNLDHMGLQAAASELRDEINNAFMRDAQFDSSGTLEQVGANHANRDYLLSLFPRQCY